MVTRPGGLSSKLHLEHCLRSASGSSRLQAYKRALAPKEILLNSYFYSRTSSQSYKTPFSSMPISSS